MGKVLNFEEDNWENRNNFENQSMSLRFVNSLSLTTLYQYSIHILMLCVIYKKHNCSLVTYWQSIPSFECFYYEREHNSSSNLQ